MGDTVGLEAPVILDFAWCFIVDSMGGFNLLLVVVVGYFLVSFWRVEYS
jgi:hypothetical protein